MMPSQRLIARPLGQTSTSLAVQSVSGPSVEAQSVHANWPGHLEVARERFAREAQHVLAHLHVALVKRPPRHEFRPAAIRAAGRRDREVRVVDERVVRLVGRGSRRRERPSPDERVRVAVGVEVPALPVGTRERPFVLVAPLPDAHDEELDRRLGLRAVVDALEPVVEPALLHRFEVHLRARPRSRASPVPCRFRERVRPRPDDEARPARRLGRAILAQPVPGVEHVVRVEVVPAAHQERRDLDPVQWHVLAVAPPPAACRVIQPVAPVADVLVRLGRCLEERKPPERLGPVKLVDAPASIGRWS